MDINYKLIGKRISDLRRSNGMTQEDLAEICDVSTRFISYVETGRKRASLKILVTVSDALFVSLDELIFGMPFTMKTQSDRLAEVIMDCNGYERRVLTDTVIALKKALRLHSNAG